MHTVETVYKGHPIDQLASYRSISTYTHTYIRISNGLHTDICIAHYIMMPVYQCAFLPTKYAVEYDQSSSVVPVQTVTISTYMSMIEYKASTSAYTYHRYYNPHILYNVVIGHVATLGLIELL